MAIVHTLKQGMTDPLQLTLKDKNGNTVNLTGSTVTFNMQEPDGTQIVDDQAVTVTGASVGEVEYEWATGDTDEAGEFEAEVHELTAAGKVVVYPQEEYLIVIILEDRKT
jgi:uncharacterized protein YfaS (alpha-2-macroglobulin family)